jgi:hypothetical protein
MPEAKNSMMVYSYFPTMLLKVANPVGLNFPTKSYGLDRLPCHFFDRRTQINGLLIPLCRKYRSTREFRDFLMIVSSAFT